MSGRPAVPSGQLARPPALVVVTAILLVSCTSPPIHPRPSAPPVSSERPAIDPRRAILWSVRDAVLVVDPATGASRRVIRLPDPSYPEAMWAPGHDAIAYQAGRYGRKGWVELDLSTGKRTMLLHSGTLAWSPDGTEIAHSSHAGVYASRPGVTIARASNLTPLSRARVPCMIGVVLMAWAPGPDPIFKGLGLMRNPSGTFGTSGESWIYLVDPRTDAVSLVTKAYDPGLPKWTPDGSRILFVRYSRAPVGAWTIRLDGTGRTPLPNSAHALAADYSPDGRWVAMVKWVGPPPVRMRLWVMHPDPTPTRLDQRSPVTMPRWTGDSFGR
jgi:hypothetical protein